MAKGKPDVPKGERRTIKNQTAINRAERGGRGAEMKKQLGTEKKVEGDPGK